ncbi:MAG: hypothetical protein ACO1TE_17450 [Prosthecobacter sp.]
MNRQRRLWTLIVASIFFGAAVLYGCYQALPVTEHGRELVGKLASVNTFSFGSVGLAGPPGPGAVIPEREDWFFGVLESRHPHRLFRALYEHDQSTPEARAYALAGLRLTDTRAFRELAPHYVATTPTLQRAGGCYVYPEVAASDFVQALTEGKMEEYLRLREQMREREMEHAQHGE